MLAEVVRPTLFAQHLLASFSPLLTPASTAPLSQAAENDQREATRALNGRRKRQQQQQQQMREEAVWWEKDEDGANTLPPPPSRQPPSSSSQQRTGSIATITTTTGFFDALSANAPDLEGGWPLRGSSTSGGTGTSGGGGWGGQDAGLEKDGGEDNVEADPRLGLAACAAREAAALEALALAQVGPHSEHALEPTNQWNLSADRSSLDETS